MCMSRRFEGTCCLLLRSDSVCLIDVDAYATWRKIPEDHHMRDTQHEYLRAYKKIDFFNV